MTEQTPEERLKELEREKRELRAKVMQDREAKKRAKQNKIKAVEKFNEDNKIGLNKILKLIYEYNHLSKNKRYERDIFKEIIDLINGNTKEDERDGRT